MKSLTPALLISLSIALGACGSPDEAPTTASPPAENGAVPAPDAAATPAGAPTEMLLSAEGIMPANTGQGPGMPLNFGLAEADVVAVLTPLYGREPERGTNTECGAGPLTFLDWGDDLRLAFQQGVFAGWWAGEDAPTGFTTDTGVHVGSTLAEARAANPELTRSETTIGPEFAIGEVFGLASGAGEDARVTALYAGVSCVFR